MSAMIAYGPNNELLLRYTKMKQQTQLCFYISVMAPLLFGQHYAPLLFSSLGLILTDKLSSATSKISINVHERKKGIKAF